MHKIIKEDRGYSYDGKQYRSKEEIYFSWFLDEIRPFTKSIKYEPFQIEVIPKKKAAYYSRSDKRKKCLFLREFKYTPDFVIVWDKEKMLEGCGLKYLWTDYTYGIFNPKQNIYYDIGEKEESGYKSYIDVKGGRSKYNPTLFSIKQKIIYETRGIYVQKIVPKEFLKAIDYYPKRYLWTDSGKQKRKL